MIKNNLKNVKNLGENWRELSKKKSSKFWGNSHEFEKKSWNHRIFKKNVKKNVWNTENGLKIKQKHWKLGRS